VEAAETAVCLMVKAVVLGARWAGWRRRLCLAEAARAAGELAQLQAENLRLRDTAELQAEQIAHLRRRLRQANVRLAYSLAERLRILWCVEYFRIPRRRIADHFGVARSTVWRWLRRLQDGVGLCGRKCQASVAKTSDALVRLVWEIASANPQWGRRRISLTLGSLGIFLAASTVRNLLLRSRPRPTGCLATATAPEIAQPAPRRIVARCPNHVWSVDRTRVMRWGILPTWVLAAIDHFSRRVVALCALEGPNAGWAIEVLESAFHRHQPPKHLITDQEAVFTCDAFRELLEQWHVKQRFGAVGQHASIAVTERLIWSLKHEWLRRVPIIRGLDHLGLVLDEFQHYHNHWRAHSTMGGAVPALLHAGQQWQAPDRTAKRVPARIERRLFTTAKITAFRLPACPAREAA